MKDEINKPKVMDCVERMTYAQRLYWHDTAHLFKKDYAGKPALPHRRMETSFQHERSPSREAWSDPAWIARLDEMERLSGLRRSRKRSRLELPVGWHKKVVDSQLRTG